MNSHKPEDAIDRLFFETLQPYASATPPRDAAKQLMRRMYAAAPRMRGFISLIHSLSGITFSLSHQPYYVENYGQYRPSPVLGVTVSRLSGLRLAY